MIKMNRSARQLVSFGDKKFFKLLVNYRDAVKPPNFVSLKTLGSRLAGGCQGIFSRRFLVKFGKTTVLAFCVGNTFFDVVGYPACVNGKSMQPVFNSDPESNSYRLNFSSWRNSWLRLDLDWVFVNCWAARNFKFSRGDIVVFVSPKDPYDYVIKRVIAQEDDELHSYRYEKNHVVIPKGHCWVEGDNWDNSVDSNKYGPIPTGLVFGVATHVIWPPHKWQRMSPSIPPSLLPERVVKAREDVHDQYRDGKIFLGANRNLRIFD